MIENVLDFPTVVNYKVCLEDLVAGIDPHGLSSSYINSRNFPGKRKGKGRNLLSLKIVQFSERKGPSPEVVLREFDDAALRSAEPIEVAWMLEAYGYSHPAIADFVGDDFPVIIPLDVVWKPAAGHLYAGRSLVATFRVGGIRQVDHIEYSHIDEYDRLYFAAVANED